MPDTRAHYVIEDGATDNTAALSQLRAALIAIARALDCDRHMMARSFLDDASCLLETAASLNAEHKGELLVLAGRLDKACEMIGFPSVGTCQTVYGECEIIERKMMEGTFNE